MKILKNEKLNKLLIILMLATALVLGCMDNKYASVEPKEVENKENITAIEVDDIEENETIKNNTIKGTVKSILHIDTNLNNATFDKNGIHIEGWKLATEANTKLQIYIDGKKIDESYIKYSYKYDLISIVKGYGTYNENPKPNFDINIPVDNLTQGSHTIRIEFVTQNGTILQKVQNNINIDKSIKSILNIDTNLNNTTFDKKGIHIEGWKLATEANSKLQIYIDNTKIDESYIKYAYKYDLISIVKGYGTYNENPKPNFDIDIPVDNISQGKHTVRIELVAQDGSILQKVQNTINIDKTIKSILNIDTALQNVTFDSEKIHIEGWKLATEPNTKLKVYIDNNEIDENYIKYAYKYALTTIVKGYGTAEENPTPNFDIDIPLNTLSDGKHKLKIMLVSSEDICLQEVENDIIVDNTFFRIHIETIFDRTTITNETHDLTGWLMTNSEKQTIKLMIDGQYQDNEFKRTERQDVLNYFNNIYEKENPTPGFSTDIDFSKLSIGLHQIALRVFDENDKKIGEEVIYVFLRQAITYEEGTYGKSGYAQIGDPRGSDLKYYRYGDGPNVFFATFSVHGFEDKWEHDGEELTNIANEFYETLKNNYNEDYSLSNKWTIYILPTVNPDGQKYGYTNNGPGRTTLYSQAPGNKGIDLNRCWKTSDEYTLFTDDRNYNGTEPFQAYEAQYLRDFLLEHKSQNGQTMLVDLHGWTQQLIGDPDICSYYEKRFAENDKSSVGRYGDGYLINWARNSLGNSSKPAKTALIELPNKGITNHQSVISNGLPTRYIEATIDLLKNI